MSKNDTLEHKEKEEIKLKIFCLDSQKEQLWLEYEQLEKTYNDLKKEYILQEIKNNTLKELVSTLLLTSDWNREIEIWRSSGVWFRQ
jgi:hypothetical protein